MAAMLEGMKQFCMKIDVISQRRENVLFLPSNMAAMASHLYSTMLISLHFLRFRKSRMNSTKEEGVSNTLKRYIVNR